MKRQSNPAKWDAPKNSSGRAVYGSLLLLGATLYGVLVCVPRLQQSLTMKPAPDVLTWAELVRDGLADNSYVELIKVDTPIDNDPAKELREVVASLDPAGDRTEMQNNLVQAIDGVDFSQYLSFAIKPVTVIPRGVDPSRVPPVVVMHRLDPQLKNALDEIARTGRLTGFVRPASPWHTYSQWLRNQGINFSWLEFDNDTRYVITHCKSVPTRASAGIFTGVCGLTAIVGWLLVGSARTGWLAWIFCPIPSLLTLVGAPLRWSGESRIVRWFYQVAGIIMLGASTILAYTTIQKGIDGDLMLLNIAFVMVTVGASALVAGTRFPKRVTVDSMSPSTANYKTPETDFVLRPAAPTSVTIVQTDEYFDPRLSDASDFELSNPMVGLVELLETHGFDPVKQVLLHQDNTRIFTTLSLGCHNVVHCEIGDFDHYQQVRFVSVLSDGFVVITLSPNTPHLGSPLRVGLHGVYARGTVESIVTLLSEHLDRVAAIAEERHGQLVTFDSYEKLDVFFLGRRTLLDIQNEYKEVAVVVSKATYGRFSFPGQRVESIVHV